MHTYDERGDGKGRDVLQRIYLCGKITPIEPLVQICRTLVFELGPPMQELGEVKKKKEGEKINFFVHGVACAFCLMIL